MSETIDSVLSRLPSKNPNPLPTPAYCGSSSKGIALAVESMRRHTTDEGWQIMEGLQSAGYTLCGFNLLEPSCHVPTILQNTNPGIVVVQDKREWDVSHRDFREKRAKFKDVACLQSRKDLFKLTILKDSHQRNAYHQESAKEIDCHAWIIYYHPRIVARLAPYVRPQHLIRTYHSLDSELVPPIETHKREGCLLSGALSAAYPLRLRLAKELSSLGNTRFISHPGYHRNGTATPQYLDQLSHYKVSICTSSMYGYALRKIMEATACGCVVVTDLPTDEVLPEIDGNLYRVSSTINSKSLRSILDKLCRNYDIDRQRKWAEKAKTCYDFRNVGCKLALDIEKLRLSFQ